MLPWAYFSLPPETNKKHPRVLRASPVIQSGLPAGQCHVDEQIRHAERIGEGTWICLRTVIASVAHG
jgi:hypothetical protein